MVLLYFRLGVKSKASSKDGEGGAHSCRNETRTSISMCAINVSSANSFVRGSLEVVAEVSHSFLIKNCFKRNVHWNQEKINIFAGISLYYCVI